MTSALSLFLQLGAIAIILGTIGTLVGFLLGISINKLNEGDRE